MNTIVTSTVISLFNMIMCIAVMITCSLYIYKVTKLPDQLKINRGNRALRFMWIFMKILLFANALIAFLLITSALRGVYWHTRTRELLYALTLTNMFGSVAVSYARLIWDVTKERKADFERKVAMRELAQKITAISPNKAEVMAAFNRSGVNIDMGG